MVRQGSLIWATIPDQNGKNHKCRPAVVLTPTEEIDPSDTIVVAAGTTKFTEPLPDNKVKLPWHRNGHIVTGLKLPTAVVCEWIVEISLNEVVKIGGMCPERHFNKILDQIPRLE